MKIKSILFSFALSFFFASVLSACDDSLSSTLNLAKVQVSVVNPQDIALSDVMNEVYTFRNISSGAVSTFVPSETISLLPGLYDINYQADAILAHGAKAKLRAQRTSVVIDHDSKISLDAYCIVDNDDLIIAEVFFTGTLRPSGNTYNGDQYVKLYNNSNHTIYADGISLFETKFLTTEKRVYTPDVMAEAVTVQAIYTVPGNGHDHPVLPGEYFLICDVAMDHRNANPNSFDLSKADFEWYDESSKPSTMDIDSPLAPNLDKWYCYTQTVWMLHNRGLKGYGIARIPISKESYLADYHYAFDYEVVTAAGTFPMSGEAYRMPNDWIVDMVNCSVASDYAWQVSSSALDCGWASCGTVNNDKSRFFRAVRRQLLGFTPDGRAILKDTNDSSADFNSGVIASEIELQHTAVDAAGTLSTTVTYDGITPVE